MDFIKIHDKKLKIALSAEELLRYGLTLDQFDYHNVETQKALRQMLGDAKAHCGFDVLGEALMVEVYPSRSGGCEIFVCCLDKKKKEEEIGVFAVSFDDGEEMIAASAALFVAGYREKSYLYRLCGRFYLILFSRDQRDALSALSLAYEFGREESRSVYDVVKREGQLLSENAVFQLGDIILHRREKPRL